MANPKLLGHLLSYDKEMFYTQSFNVATWWEHKDKWSKNNIADSRYKYSWAIPIKHYNNSVITRYDSYITEKLIISFFSYREINKESAEKFLINWGFLYRR